MSRFNKNFLFLLFIFIPLASFAQSCDLIINGYVKDSGNDHPLEFVTVRVSETHEGGITDSTGYFSLPPLCRGGYHLTLSHIGCEPQSFFIELKGDTSLNLSLSHSENVLEDVLILGHYSQNTTQHIGHLDAQSIADQAHENLSNMLESIVGVSSLRNGNTIAKPIVHGLYGNRLAIINNGITQSGQQWGNDHSPEIDPLGANSIQVIKGASALMYPGANLGAVVLVQPAEIAREPHVHGKASYFFETNGLGHGLNLQLQQYSKSLAWRVNGTLKKSGDKHTPDYYLNNTGAQEANLALQLEKSFSEKWHAEVYASTFNTELGVMRGSHIGNLTDLAAAFEREVPFFTPDTFSYRIDAPKQRVNHHLLKLHTTYLIDQRQSLDFTFAFQYNNRKEFDVRRGGRSERPALSLQQATYFAEAKYLKVFSPRWKLKSGLQSTFINNSNDNAATGISPLIPDYFEYANSAFTTVYRKGPKSLLELGVRYDNIVQRVVTISRTISRDLIRYENTFHNFTASGGYTWRLQDNTSLSLNLGYATRNPAINELYSFGLHQGVSGIEEGSPNLQVERSLKTTLGLKSSAEEKFSLETLFYAQGVNDYIFLNPQDRFMLTIRGAFPVFKFEQTDAFLLGFDVVGKFEFTHGWHTQLKYSFLRGFDLIQELSIINIPSNNLRFNTTYELPKAIRIGSQMLENVELEASYQYVFRQNQITGEQDFALPPEAYGLVGLKASANFPLRKARLRLIARAENLLNVAYRDYLNRQRYFADDLGRNVVLGVSLIF